MSDVSRIETVGTLIERSLWKDGAEATLRRHGHVDETNAEILQEIVDQQPVTDGGQPAASDDAAFNPFEPEPQRFAKVHVTVGGAMQFVDDDQPERWITSDTVVEVTR